MNIMIDNILDDPNMDKNMRTEFCKAFGPFGEYLIKDIKSIEVVNNLNKFYFNKFNTKKSEI